MLYFILVAFVRHLRELFVQDYTFIADGMTEVCPHNSQYGVQLVQKFQWSYSHWSGSAILTHYFH